FTQFDAEYPRKERRQQLVQCSELRHSSLCRDRARMVARSATLREAARCAESAMTHTLAVVVDHERGGSARIVAREMQPLRRIEDGLVGTDRRFGRQAFLAAVHCSAQAGLEAAVDPD